MIMGSNVPRTIGEQYKGVTNAEGIYFPNTPYRVVREATIEEYFEINEKEGVKFTLIDLLFVHAAVHEGEAFFYEIEFEKVCES
jgi:hypothetical protein